ncbi:intracellular septation protein [Rhizomicrobium palustre]|uniref:Inner membrane-spanning protein YciB n=1 Tax=Rhizomicrobium palustre TaxID=189966 RepID=A0A846N0G0_9PROT|nr:septation protein A [Rhizomicrobium palustre]NIK88670.1 intracellular septation protein [Rhizomicrobium palustre]
MNPQLRRSLTDFGPLLLFFIAYRLFDLYVATAVIMAAAVTAAILGFVIDRKLNPMPIFTAVVVVIFGGLTLYLNDKTFIKMKPTMIYALFGAILIGGVWFKRPFVKTILGTAFAMADKAWAVLSLRFGGFFLAMAVLNELIWRNFSESFWVNFHTFGAIALTILFCFSQAPFLLRHQMDTPAE